MNHVTKHRAVGTNNDRVIVEEITRVLTWHYAERHLELAQRPIIRDSKLASEFSSLDPLFGPKSSEDRYISEHPASNELPAM